MAAIASGCSASPAGDSPGELEGKSGDSPINAFHKEFLLSDAELSRADTLTAPQIDAFLALPYPDYGQDRSCLASMSFDGRSAGFVIADAAKAHGINPLYLLAQLQKESSLVGNSSAKCPADKLDAAMGCACPDGSECDTSQSGFVRQIECAASVTRSFLDDIASKGETISGWAPMRTSTTLDGRMFAPANAATAALYTYTPWVGDLDAEGYQAPFGNYLFWKNWVQFGRTIGLFEPSPPAKDGCSVDADCHGGQPGTQTVCSDSGSTKGSCITACHSDFDCPGSSTCNLSSFTCAGVQQQGCQKDSSCNGGMNGQQVVCVAGACVQGCHEHLDCPSTHVCDKTASKCVLPDQQGCQTDADCNGGSTGTEVICSDGSKLCKTGCHSNADCPAGKTCDTSVPSWVCVAPPSTDHPIGSSITQSYDPAAAVEYAHAHWDDGKGLCAEFVSDCTITNGLDLEYSTWVPTWVDNLAAASVPFDEYSPGQPIARACPGDIVIYSNDVGDSFCTDPGGDRNCGHIGIVVQGGDSLDAILGAFHNSAHDNEPLGWLLTTQELGPYVDAYSTLRVYHLANCSWY